MNREKIYYFIIFLVVGLLCMMLFSYKFEISEIGYNRYSTSSDNNISFSEKIHDNTVITQKINVENNNLKKMYIYFNNNDVIDKTGVYEISVKNKKNKLIYRDKVAYVELSNDGKYQLTMKNIKKGIYNVEIKYSGCDTNFVPIVNEANENFHYIVDGDSITGTLVFDLLYFNKSKNVIFYSLMIFIYLLLSIIALFVIKSKEKRIERKFLYLAIPIFLMYMLFLPLYMGHDELFHWYRVYEITDGGLLPEIENNSTGYEVPKNVGSGLAWNKNLEYGDIVRDASRKLDYNDKQFISDVTMSVYSPIQYFLQIVGVTFGKLITDRSVLISYVGRLFNVLICIYLLYNAIKLAPYGKNLLFVLAFIPIAVEGFTTLSGDGFTISTAYLFISYILNIKNSKRMLLKKDFAILSILGIVLAFCKIIYIPIVFMLFLLPKESFKSNKKRWIYLIMMIMLFIFCNLLWLKLANPYLQVYTDGKSSYQIKYIFSHPIRYCQNFLYTIQQNGINYILELYGTGMLWGNAVNNYTFVPIIMIILTLIACINESDFKNKFNLKESIIVVLIILAVIALMFTSLYVQWTSYAQNKIEGVQGRYFLPIITLVYLVIGNYLGGKIKLDNKKVDKLIIVGIVLVSFMCIMECIVKYI